jgi:hypothetical protein
MRTERARLFWKYRGIGSESKSRAIFSPSFEFLNLGSLQIPLHFNNITEDIHVPAARATEWEHSRARAKPERQRRAQRGIVKLDEVAVTTRVV